MGEILRGVGYDDDTIARVQDLVRKRGLGKDPEVQTLEDALCLVFLETQFDDLAARLDPEKLARRRRQDPEEDESRRHRPRRRPRPHRRCPHPPHPLTLSCVV